MHRCARNTLIGLITLGSACIAAPASATSGAASAPPAADSASAASREAAPPFGFLPGSTSWTSPTDGWLHGFTDCDLKRCGWLQSTDDGGATWTPRTSPPLDLPSTGDGVRIVFAPATNEPADTGYATGNQVFITEDGASTWSRVKLSNLSAPPQIGDTVATSRRVYAIVGQGDVYTGRTDLYSAKIGAHRWRPVAGVTVQGNGVNADGGWDVVANGRHVAVALGRLNFSNAFWTSHDAKTFAESTPPCAVTQETALGAVSAHRTAALCAYGDTEFGQQTKDLYASEDGGPFELVNSAPVAGSTSDYVSLAAGEEVVSTYNSTGGSFIHRSVETGWTTPLYFKFIRPFLDLQFVDNQHGFVVWGGDHSDLGSLWETQDGGHNWNYIDYSS